MIITSIGVLMQNLGVLGFNGEKTSLSKGLVYGGCLVGLIGCLVQMNSI